MNELIYEISKREVFKGVSFYSSGLAKDNAKTPYVTWQIISDNPFSGIGFEMMGSNIRVQFDIYSSSEKEVLTLSGELEKELLGVAIVEMRQGPRLEFGTKLYRRVVDMSFFNKGEK